MAKPTFTDILFCWTFALAGVVILSYGLDTCLNSPYHGAGLFVALAGLGMLAMSTIDSDKGIS